MQAIQKVGEKLLARVCMKTPQNPIETKSRRLGKLRFSKTTPEKGVFGVGTHSWFVLKGNNKESHFGGVRFPNKSHPKD